MGKRNSISRRDLLRMIGAGAGAAMVLPGCASSRSQAPQLAQSPGDFLWRSVGASDEQFAAPTTNPLVSLIHGEDRRKNAYDALMAIDDQLQPKLSQKKYVVIKPNLVRDANQLAATHVDALRGILDYMSERFNGPVVVAESGARDTQAAFENFLYNRLPSEYSKQNVKLIDLDEEAKYEQIELANEHYHIVPVRLAARLLDPEAFVLSACMPKTHNTVVATLSVKNMVFGSPIRSAPGETPMWTEKRKLHVGYAGTHYNMIRVAQRISPNWGATLIDGFQGMEGNGPSDGTPVEHKVALASTDLVAADRVALETMGIDPDWVGYLQYCANCGIGQYDLSKINVIGAPIADVKREYEMSPYLKEELEWRGPLADRPKHLGWHIPEWDGAQG